MKTDALNSKDQKAMTLTTQLTASLVLGVATLLSGCGGSSGDPQRAQATAPASGAQATTRVLPGFDVTVTAIRAAGAAATSFDVKVSDPAKVSALKAVIGTDVERGVAAVASAGAAGSWTVAVAAGAAPDAGLQLLFTLTDGDSIETGTGDFPLK